MPARRLAAVLLCALAAGLIGLAMARFLEGVELVFYGVDAPSLPDRVAQAGWRSALAPAAGGLGAGPDRGPALHRLALGRGKGEERHRTSHGAHHARRRASPAWDLGLLGVLTQGDEESVVVHGHPGDGGH